MVLQQAPSRAVIWGYGPVISENTSVTVTVDNNSTRRTVYHTTVKYTGMLLDLTPITSNCYYYNRLTAFFPGQPG